MIKVLKEVYYWQCDKCGKELQTQPTEKGKSQLEYQIMQHNMSKHKNNKE